MITNSLGTRRKGLGLLMISILASLGLLSSVQASRVIWQSIPGMTNINSLGEPFDEDVTFEIGFFQAGFTPTALNTQQWASRWTTVGRATYNPTDGFFANTVTFTNNDTPYSTGRQAYMWGSTGGARPEWLLATSTKWGWPSAALGLPTVWQIGEATKVIVGTINVGGTPFHLRTASVADPFGASLTPEQWLERHFTGSELADSAMGQLTSDPDGDGLDNLLEMALGRDPKVSDAIPSLSDILELQGYTYLRLSVPKQAILGLRYIVEVSSDLVSWESGELETTTLKDDATTYVVRDNTALEEGVRRFIKLTVSVSG